MLQCLTDSTFMDFFYPVSLTTALSLSLSLTHSLSPKDGIYTDMKRLATGMGHFRIASDYTS
jgi:hypothetical protein